MSSQNRVYFDSRSSNAHFKLSEELYGHLVRSPKSSLGVSVVCIGTDRSTGDSYGPIVGHILDRLPCYGQKVYGSLKSTVHALSLGETLGRIDTEKTLVLAVDCSVGSADYIGCIGIGSCPLQPGSGVGKRLPDVGDISITGIVTASGASPHALLQTTSLGLVYSMAEKTAFSILRALFLFSGGRKDMRAAPSFPALDEEKNALPEGARLA